MSIIESNAEEMNRLKVELAKAYIAHVDEIKEQVRLLKERREMLENIGGLRGIDYAKDKVKTSPNDDAVPNAVVKLMEAQEAEQASMEFEQREIDEFEDRIVKLTGRGGLILQCLYLMGVELTDVQIYRQYMPMPKSTYFRRKDEGLLELYNNGLPEAYKLPDEKAV